MDALIENEIEFLEQKQLEAAEQAANEVLRQQDEDPMGNNTFKMMAFG